MQSIQEVFSAVPDVTRLVVFRTKADNRAYRRNRRWLAKGQTGYWTLDDTQIFDGVALLIDSKDGRSVEVWVADHCDRIGKRKGGWIVGRLDGAPFKLLGRVSAGISLNEFVGMQLSQLGFNYVEPTRRTRQARRSGGPRDQVREGIPPTGADETPFDPKNVEDARLRVERMIRERRGQRAFRDALIRAYQGKCAVTVAVAPKLHASEYGKLDGRKLRLPRRLSDAPSEQALISRRRSNPGSSLREWKFKAVS